MINMSIIKKKHIKMTRIILMQEFELNLVATKQLMKVIVVMVVAIVGARYLVQFFWTSINLND